MNVGSNRFSGHCRRGFGRASRSARGARERGPRPRRRRADDRSRGVAMTAGSAGVREEIRRLRIELEIAGDAVAAAAGLNPRDLDVLDVITAKDRAPPRGWRTAPGNGATLTSVLHRLEGDGRSAILVSTDRFDGLRALHAPLDAVEDRLAAELAAAELAVVARALALIADHVPDAAGDDGRSVTEERQPAWAGVAVRSRRRRPRRGCCRAWPWSTGRARACGRRASAPSPGPRRAGSP